MLLFEKRKGKSTMTRDTIQFDNDLKALSEGVYLGNENSIPKDWLKLSEFNEKKSGFHAEVFYKNGNIVIAMRGTDEIWKDFVKEDVLKMGLKKLPSQYVDAQKSYKKIERAFRNVPDKKIIFTGHSLGGSLAQLMANKTGCDAVTFNAYGTAELLKGNIGENSNNIRNYGNINDKVFVSNIDNQLGKTYVINDNTDNTTYITSSHAGENNSGEYYTKYHFINTMGNLENAVEYKSNRVSGGISYDIDYKDIDNNRIFTREEIGAMSLEEFERQENFIYQQLSAGKVMSEAKAQEELRAGTVIWVNAYTRRDGTYVKGYYRSLPD